MSTNASAEAAKAVVRRNTDEVQGKGNYDVFEELFAEDFVDHTPQPGMTPDKAGARGLYKTIRAAFPDFHAVIHWQTVDGEIVTTFKTYHGTHFGSFLGVAPTGNSVHFETVDAMRVRKGKITEHWGVANLFSLMEQLRSSPPMRMDATTPLQATIVRPEERLKLEPFGLDMRILLSTEATGGATSVIMGWHKPGEGPPDHVHFSQEEVFFIVEGIYELTVGGQTSTIGPGTIVFIPRDVVHRFRNVGGTRACMLDWSLPGGQDHYFKAGGGFTGDKVIEISKKFDTNFPAAR
jgi:mannose-6-phosphate isomerase-like protein (cupin superfamily)